MEEDLYLEMSNWICAVFFFRRTALDVCEPISTFTSAPVGQRQTPR